MLIGAALLYGDGIITPSISVLSAVEGLSVATDKLEPAVVPITCVLLVGLFAIQRRGTASVGKMFGPVMVLWFVTLGALGLRQIIANPEVLEPLSPLHAIDFFQRHGFGGLAVLGGVVLAVTGGEALYADMGHFGARPIRLGWWTIAMPALILNYFGQGALLLAHLGDPKAIDNPFYALVEPGMQTYALVVLSTLATIIASQALISGAFSLTHQAVQLGFFPRVTIRHTSREAEGQIYVPSINWGLMVACVALVIAFQHSSQLASAYGIAVTGTMGITSVVYYVVTRETWGWSRMRALPLLVLFLSFDLPFFAANLTKFVDGGYVPLIVGAFVFTIMVIWKQGRALLLRRVIETSPDLAPFIADLGEVVRVPSIGVYAASHVDHVPPSVVYQAKRMRVLPETVILFNLVHEPVPNVVDGERVEASSLGGGFYRVIGHVGFMDRPDVPAMIEDGDRAARAAGDRRHDLLPQSRYGARDRRGRDERVSRGRVRVPAAQRRARDPLLRDSSRPRHRAGHAVRSVAHVDHARVRRCWLDLAGAAPLPPMTPDIPAKMVDARSCPTPTSSVARS